MQKFLEIYCFYMQFHIKNIFLKEKTDFFQKKICLEKKQVHPSRPPLLRGGYKRDTPSPDWRGDIKEKEYMFSLVPMCSEYQKERISFLFFSLKSLENHYLK